MKAAGIIEIGEGLILNNPSLEIEQITYKQSVNEVSVECIFKEENAIYQHSRTFVFASTKDMLKADVLLLMSTHDVLKEFK